MIMIIIMIIHNNKNINLFFTSARVLIHRYFTSQSNKAVQFEKRKYGLVDDYQITGFLGKGSTSRVYQGYNVLTNQQVTIKLFKDIIAEEKIIRQISVNRLICTCPHVIPLLDVVRDEGCGIYGLIFKNLFGVPLTHLQKTISFQNKLKHIKNILEALSFCHKNGVVHRDLKKSNILITKTGAKLFDFGLSYIENVHDFNVSKRFGTKSYYSPQVVFRVPKFNRKIDVWVCGSIIGQFLIGKQLMPYSSDELTKRQIVHFSGYNQEIVQDLSLKHIKRINFYKLFQNVHQDTKLTRSLAQMVEKMMRINPQERPQIQDILQSQAFQLKWILDHE